jgi:hypothetical protein
VALEDTLVEKDSNFIQILFEPRQQRQAQPMSMLGVYSQMVFLLGSLCQWKYCLKGYLDRHKMYKGKY